MELLYIYNIKILWYNTSTMKLLQNSFKIIAH